MTLAIYNCIWTPLTISFDWAIDQDQSNGLLAALEHVILAVYVTDIGVQLLTSYYNVTTGDEI